MDIYFHPTYLTFTGGDLFVFNCESNGFNQQRKQIKNKRKIKKKQEKGTEKRKTLKHRTRNQKIFTSHQ